jgi:nitrogen PTS system EIIA component
MPLLQLDVRRVAAVLNVPENTVYRWISERKLPAHGVEGRYRFARAELLEWATKHHVNLSLEIFDEGSSDQEGLLVAEALEAGGIFYDICGADKDAVLSSMVDNIPLPEGFDAEMLLQLFLAREAMGSTAVGNGVAIPHTRHPVVLPIARPHLSLCFLAQPIEFGAASGEPVHTLFVLLSPTIQSHLQILARIASLLRDDRLGQVLSARKSRREILSDVRRAEQAFNDSAVGKNSEH